MAVYLGDRPQVAWSDFRPLLATKFSPARFTEDFRLLPIHNWNSKKYTTMMKSL